MINVVSVFSPDNQDRKWAEKQELASIGSQAGDVCEMKRFMLKA